MLALPPALLAPAPASLKGLSSSTSWGLQLSGEQIGPDLGELHECPALVQHEPAALDRQLEPCAILCRRAIVLEPCCAIEPFLFSVSNR
jgi:hypothetical protein